MFYFYLYQITNTANGKIYVGVHKTRNLDDGYMGSGKILKHAIAKHGINNFTKDILEYFDTSEAMYAREKEVVNEEFLLREDTYNLRRGGNGGWDYILDKKLNMGFLNKRHSSKTKEQISQAKIGRKMSEQAKQKMSDNNWAKTNPIAQKSHAVTAAKKSHQNRNKMLHSDAAKEKISNSLKIKYLKDGHPLVGFKRDKIQCPYCAKVGAKNVMKRWHFENCKLKIKNI